ncbi:hypothetical protein O9G_001292 [Rozella allomycis CSF55]|uniref:Uncharacterized protein n=1 Tax=Rozella allomycis (strain CSF55) TaxID=988480 RepID=A0A075ATE5_ROZAC|nr:hypothetical protein O9G_001292 [Rozella allomycis CSF55]|eukprot:EPZ33541.1 hypothetical protein O9G_001292 [Rozella allomycis CSF55]
MQLDVNYKILPLGYCMTKSPRFKRRSSEKINMDCRMQLFYSQEFEHKQLVDELLIACSKSKTVHFNINTTLSFLSPLKWIKDSYSFTLDKEFVCRIPENIKTDPKLAKPLNSFKILFSVLAVAR